MRHRRDQRWTGPKGAVLLLSSIASGCVAPVEDLRVPEIALLAPSELDLGWVAQGEAAEGTFPLENVGPSTVVIDGIRTLAPRPDADVEGQLETVWLGPGEVIDVAVRMLAGPEAIGELVVPIQVLVPGLEASDPRQPVVDIFARVSPSGLVAEPNPLTIGPVLYRDTQTATIAIRNLRSTPTDVLAFNYANGRVQYDEAVTRGAFGPLPTVDGLGRIVTLGPKESFEVSISYTAPASEGEAKEQALWRVGSCPDPNECALDLVVQGLPDDEAPELRLSPSGVHFGQTPVSAEVERDLYVANIGERPLAVSDLAFSGSSEFVANLPADFELPPRQMTKLQFSYAPVDETADNALLTFRTNDPLRRTVEVRVTGAGVVLPPCDLEPRPPSVEFGTVPVGDTRSGVAVVFSAGQSRCVVFDPQVEHTNGTAVGTFILDANAPPSVTLEPGQEARYNLLFAPPTPGGHSAVLRLRTSPTESIEIPLQGRTPGDASLICTGDRSSEVGAPLRLTAALSRQAMARSYRWRLLSGPTQNGQIAAQILPNADTGPSVELLPELLGVYEVQAEVETDTGDRFTCRTRITAVSSGFRATLTWDGPGDLDLHLHGGGQGPWFGPDDCHFDNLSPVWMPGTMPGAGANPALDRDDTSGEGPETIRIETPLLGVPYTVAVGHFERARGRIAQVQVYCGRAGARLNIGSRPFAGRDTGACTRNDFWTIATVTFTAPDQCEVQMHDTYRETREACAAF